MSLNRRTVLSYLAAVLIPLAIASQWHKLLPTLQQVPGYVYLLLVALAARFLGFGAAVCGIVASFAVLAVCILYRLFPAEGMYLRLALFLAASVVIASVSRRQSEEAREANERYRTLVELAPDGIAVTDETGRILFANSALAKIVGASRPSEIIGRSAMEFLVPDDHEEARRRLEQLTSGKPTSWIATRAIRVDGTYVDVERAGIPLRIGKKVFAQGFIRDLTERKQAEAKIEESGRRLQALFEKALDAIVFVDSNGHYVDANPAACELLGYTRDELLEMKIGDLSPPEQRERALAVWGDMLSEKRFSGEGNVRRKDGQLREIEFRVVANVVPGLHFSILHDITARKEAERSLAQLSARLLRSQDEERRRIARQLHDTTAQNLAALRLDLARISRAAVAADPAIKRTVDDSIALADQSIAEIRTLSYLLHPPLIDEAGLLPTLRWFARGFEERSGIKVKLDTPEELDRLPLESETAVFRIIQEALTNIQRHSGSPLAHIRLVREPESLRLEVADEGSGIPTDLREQGEAAFAAAGVGIAGMQERVRELGGSMRIESETTGTKIAVTLPITKG